MMNITSIRQQTRAKDRYSVYVDGAYSFSVSDGLLLDSKITVGQEVTPAQITDFKRLSSEDKLYSRALRYAAMRRRSRWELEQYLSRKEASPALAEIILNKLSVLGFVDDLAFAEVWVANRHLLRPTSRRKLRLELRAKRIADDIIQQVLHDDERTDHDELQALIIRKRRQTKYQDNAKLMQYLARQGFSYEDIKAVLANEGGADDI